tara:strand:+ start:804 stop:1025 length:222 start_codon:yes stop_codon:yes gene_type:complete
MPKTKLTKEEFDSFKQKWIKDTVYFMDRSLLENYAWLYFEEDLKNQDQESAFETMENIDDEVFSNLAKKFNID